MNTHESPTSQGNQFDAKTSANSQSSRQIFVLDGEERPSVIEALNHQAHRYSDRFQQSVSTVRMAAVERVRLIKEALGERKFQALVDFSREHLRACSLDYSPKEMELIDAAQAEKQRRQRIVKDFLRTSDIDLDGIRALNLDYHDKVTSVFKPTDADTSYATLTDQLAATERRAR